MEEELPKLDPFVAPDFSLPSYDNILKGAPSVFLRDGNNKPVPRKPTVDEELRGFAARNTNRPNTQKELIGIRTMNRQVSETRQFHTTLTST